ncbi:MAG: hypothetical protein D6689_07065 [Deltaproteobacteria bacterium]|nr:MAG: hypothetical protein D6689_07065 [Deltaproteobacteria bacterium]
MSGDFKAVCYKCSYVGRAGQATHCPICRFPLIVEAGAPPEVAPMIEHIFDRASVHLGAPPLPGVDDGPRKAVLLMEARRRRIARQRRLETQRKLEAERRRARWTLGAVGVSAGVVAGVVAALLVSGGL